MSRRGEKCSRIPPRFLIATNRNTVIDQIGFKIFMCDAEICFLLPSKLDLITFDCHRTLPINRGIFCGT